MTMYCFIAQSLAAAIFGSKIALSHNAKGARIPHFSTFSERLSCNSFVAAANCRGAIAPSCFLNQQVE
jgi:hypothetical protein